MGTLGFLTPFDLEHLHPVLDRILHPNNVIGNGGQSEDYEGKDPSKKIWSTLRQRLRCEIVRHGTENRTGDPRSKRLILNDLWIGTSKKKFKANIFFRM